MSEENTKSSSRKLVVRLAGGLGNQLFLYATGLRLARVSGAELVVDQESGFARDRKYGRSYALASFSTSARPATLEERYEPLSFVRRRVARELQSRKEFFSRTYLAKTTPDFDPRLLEFRVTRPCTLEGYWFGWRYFEDASVAVRRELTPAVPREPKVNELAERIRKSECPVAIHMRFFDPPSERESKKNSSLEYYRSAMARVARDFGPADWFVFSDQPEYARVALEPSAHRLTIVENDPQRSAAADLWLMGSCRHFIIGSSTFGWWGAWLGMNSGKTVFYPKTSTDGFGAMVPPDWVAM
jgi:hypothetical protein